MGITEWGRCKAGLAHQVEITDGGQCRAVISDFGARLIELWVPSPKGESADIILGHDRVEDYETPETRFAGATCGRFANRIAKGQFRVDGTLTKVDQNEGENTLHGGHDGFDAKLWSISRATAHEVVFALTSADGDMGFPGALMAEVRYGFTAPHRLEITMTARVKGAPTVVNLVNHAYFNPAGQGSGTIDRQVLNIAADHYLPVDATLLPTGEVAPVAGTPFDFRPPRELGALVPEGGFDHNLCLTAQKAPQITARDPVSGRGFQLWTDQPGVQLYTAKHLPSGLAGKAGAKLGPRSGFTLETQHWPDSPNRPAFPPTLLRPGEVYQHQMVFTFLTV